MTAPTNTLPHEREHHDTKARILEVAERLFMEHGFSATSLRMITGDAKVNLASVNYHFGSKEALIEAVFTRRLSPLNRERIKHMEEFIELRAQLLGPCWAVRLRVCLIVRHLAIPLPLDFDFKTFNLRKP